MPAAAEHAGEITARFAAVQIALTPQQAEGLAIYLAELQRWSSRINLTRFTTVREIIQEHFIDSAMGLPLLPAGPHCAIDLGTGAGFPGLVLKILRPEMSLWLVESVQKKASFLGAVIGHLGLSQVTVLSQRAEAAALEPHLHRRMAVVMARALAKPPVAVALCRPFCAASGRVLLSLTARMQPPWPADFAVAGERRYLLPGHSDERIVVALTPRP